MDLPTYVNDFIQMSCGHTYYPLKVRISKSELNMETDLLEVASLQHCWPIRRVFFPILLYRYLPCSCSPRPFCHYRAQHIHKATCGAPSRVSQKAHSQLYIIAGDVGCDMWRRGDVGCDMWRRGDVGCDMWRRGDVGCDMWRRGDVGCDMWRRGDVGVTCGGEVMWGVTCGGEVMWGVTCGGEVMWV